MGLEGVPKARRLLSDIEMANNEKVAQLIVVVFILVLKAAVYHGAGRWGDFHTGKMT